MLIDFTLAAAVAIDLNMVDPTYGGYSGGFVGKNITISFVPLHLHLTFFAVLQMELGHVLILSRPIQDPLVGFGAAWQV